MRLIRPKSESYSHSMTLTLPWRPIPRPRSGPGGRSRPCHAWPCRSGALQGGRKRAFLFALPRFAHLERMRDRRRGAERVRLLSKSIVFALPASGLLERVCLRYRPLAYLSAFVCATGLAAYLSAMFPSLREGGGAPKSAVHSWCRDPKTARAPLGAPHALKQQSVSACYLRRWSAPGPASHCSPMRIPSIALK